MEGHWGGWHSPELEYIGVTEGEGRRGGVDWFRGMKKGGDRKSKNKPPVGNTKP